MADGRPGAALAARPPLPPRRPGGRGRRRRGRRRHALQHRPRPVAARRWPSAQGASYLKRDFTIGTLSGAPAPRTFRRRRRRHRRADAGRPAVLHRPPDHRLRAVVDDRHAASWSSSRSRSATGRWSSRRSRTAATTSRSSRATRRRVAGRAGSSRPSASCARRAGRSTTRIMARRGASSRPTSRCVIRKADTYRGEAASTTARSGSASFEPMCGADGTRFKIDGGKVRARPHRSRDRRGDVVRRPARPTSARWPEQIYPVQVARRLPAHEARSSSRRTRFTLAGRGDFVGTFHLFKGGRELKGRFASLETRLNDWRFPGLEGSAAVGARSLRGDHGPRPASTAAASTSTTR